MILPFLLVMVMMVLLEMMNEMEYILVIFVMQEVMSRIKMVMIVAVQANISEEQIFHLCSDFLVSRWHSHPSRNSLCCCLVTKFPMTSVVVRQKHPFFFSVASIFFCHN